MQWALLSKKGSTSAFVFPSLKKSFTLQVSERKTEPSNIVYLRVFKDPADNGDTMQKILDFYSELFQVGKRLQYLVVVGDGKTYEYLRKLKYQYRPDWLILFPGDWHICKNYPTVLMKIYWHAGLKNMAENAGNKTKILNSLEKFGSFQRTHNFLIQSFHAILRCQIDAFFESLSPDTDEHHSAFFHTLSLMFETISKSKSSHGQIEAFNEIQKFVSVSPDSEALHKSFHAFCQSVCVEDDTCSLWREFVTGSMLPYLGLYLSMRSEQ